MLLIIFIYNIWDKEKRKEEKRREEKRESWMREMEIFERNWGRGKHNQNMLCKKISIRKERNKAKRFRGSNKTKE